MRSRECLVRLSRRIARAPRPGLMSLRNLSRQKCLKPGLCCLDHGTMGTGTIAKGIISGILARQLRPPLKGDLPPYDRLELQSAYGKGAFATVLRAQCICSGLRGHPGTGQKIPLAIKIQRSVPTVRRAGEREAAMLEWVAAFRPARLVVVPPPLELDASSDEIDQYRRADLERQARLRAYRTHCVALRARFEWRRHLCLAFPAYASNMRQRLATLYTTQTAGRGVLGGCPWPPLHATLGSSCKRSRTCGGLGSSTPTSSPTTFFTTPSTTGVCWPTLGRPFCSSHPPSVCCLSSPFAVTPVNRPQDTTDPPASPSQSEAKLRASRSGTRGVGPPGSSRRLRKRETAAGSMSLLGVFEDTVRPVAPTQVRSGRRARRQRGGGPSRPKQRATYQTMWAFDHWRTGYLLSQSVMERLLAARAQVGAFASSVSTGSSGHAPAQPLLHDPAPYLCSGYYRPPEIILGAPHGYSVDIWSPWLHRL